MDPLCTCVQWCLVFIHLVCCGVFSLAGLFYLLVLVVWVGVFLAWTLSFALGYVVVHFWVFLASARLYVLIR